MNKDKVERIVKKWLPKYIEALQLENESIRVSVVAIPPDKNGINIDGDVGNILEENFFDIRLNYVMLLDEDGVKRTLWHELLHIVHKELYLYQKVNKYKYPEVWSFGVERLVVKLKDLLDYRKIK